MNELKRLRISRRGFRSHTTKLLSGIAELITLDTSSINQETLSNIELTIEQLQRKQTILEELDAKIVPLIEDESELEEEIMEAEDTRTKILHGISRLKVKLNSVHVESTEPPPVAKNIPTVQPLSAEVIPPTHSITVVSTTSNPTTLRTASVTTNPILETATDIPEINTLPTEHTTVVNTASYPTSRLPKLSIPTFSGDPLTWQSFWDCFDSAVNSNGSLTNVQKLSYLRAQLQGDASKVVAGFPLTNTSYTESVTLLKSRFGQPHKLIAAHMQALLHQSKPTNTLSSLQSFHDSVEGHVRSLTSLGKPLDSYADMLVPVILEKLPGETRKHLARERTDGEWTFKGLQEAVLKEIRVFESILNTLPPSSHTPTATFHTGGRRVGTQPTTGDSKKRVCIYCKGSHACMDCEVVTQPSRRLEIVRQQNLCFNCLARHKVSQCTSRHRCRKCSRKHHTSLCNQLATSDGPSNSTDQNRTTTDTVTTPTTTAGMTTIVTNKSASLHVTGDNVCLLKTAIANVHANKIGIEANILLDEGSQRSFLTESLASSLQLHPDRTEDISLASFGSSSASIRRLNVATIYLETITGSKLPLSVLLVPTIAAPIQNTSCSAIANLPYLRGLKLANQMTTGEQFEITLLIGADYYWQVVEDQIIRGQGPIAMKSKLGYLLSGPLTPPHQCLENGKTSVFHISTHSGQTDVFWNIESVATSPDPIDPHKTVMAEYQRTCISREADGSYKARFPWKLNHPTLPTNLTLCERRTRALARRLATSPHLLIIYNNILNDQEQRGFIEKVKLPSVTSNCHYIPHHAVKKESPTTPIRIVYDCSCHQSNASPSLNDCLQMGAPFLQDLCSVIVRFRLHRFAISTDIEKAFLHVHLHEKDRDFTRFLWLSDPSNPESEFIVYRFKVVLFGATCSPFILNSVIHHHLSNYTSSVAQDMLNSLYVDNVISGCDTEESTLEYYTTSRAIMKEAKFNLRSWSSNSSILTAKASQDKVAADATDVNVLGMKWNTITDTLYLTQRTPLSNHSNLVTKREVLRESSAIFDPLGLISPVTIKARIFIQHLWQQQLQWDEPLQQSDQDQWLTITKDIGEATTTAIARQYFTGEHIQTPCQLHVFTDASTKAYGAVVFLSNGYSTSFVMSKARVAPLKQLTLPKLELMGALTGARLCNFVSQTLNIPLSFVHLWSDSQIVLYWLSSNKKLNQFVSHRISEIHLLTATATWRYCPTEDNPADLLTRGISAAQMQLSQAWHSGPPWLTNHNNWPVWQPSATLHLQAAVVTTEEFVPATSTSSPPSNGLHQIINLNNFSTLEKVVRVTAIVLRFIANLKSKDTKQTGPITAIELHTATLLWVKDCQQQTFYSELYNIRSSTSKRLPLVRQLRLFIDEHGFIRCGGRIHNAPVDQTTKFPYLLPPRHLLTSMIIHSTHIKLFHAGTNSTVTAIRQMFWIPKARQRVRSLLRSCTICKKHCGRPYPLPDSPPLPEIRMHDVVPFTVTGIDFTGALYVRINGVENKVYICLFTCATTRGVHLEIVTDLTTDTFLLALRRFVSRKSLPRIIVSDNASTYLSAAEELKELLSSRKLTESLGKRGVVWKFIPKRAPWYGGWWERLIGLTKTALKKTLGRANVSLTVLETLIVEIEAVLNDRPLTYTPSEFDEADPLTPAHLLYGRRITSLPYESVYDDEIDDPNFGDESSIRRLAKRQALTLQHFKSRWKREYITSLREYHKTVTGYGTTKQKIAVGDIVLVQDDTPRMYWKLAVIEELIVGRDGLVRAAHIRTMNGRTNRPISKLCPLEVCSHETSTDNAVDVSADGLNQDDVDPPVTEVKSPRPQRTSKRKAQQQISTWIKDLGGPEDVED